MGTIGTFDSFTTARLGIYAAQHGLRVTGNNISNINTAGYTRQRIDQISLKTGGHDMYRSILDNHVGNGALVTAINQVRDPYLDIRFRNTNSEVGYTDTMLAGLQEIADTLDEVGKGVESAGHDEGDGLLYAQLQDMFRSLERLSMDPNKENDTLVRNDAAALAKLFNNYATSLETLKNNMTDSYKQNLSSVNEILTNIRNLNEEIRKNDIVGDGALEMRDERNRQIDELSKYMHIRVEYSMEDIGGGLEVEKLTIKLGDANPDPMVKTDETVLIDGIFGSQMVIRQVPKENPNYDPTKPFGGENKKYLDENGKPCLTADAAMIDSPYYEMDVTKLVDSRGRRPLDPSLRPPERPDLVQLEDNDLHGSLQAQRELLTEKGEFATQEDVDRDPKATTKRGIPYYQMSLDLLARTFAKAYNDLNTGKPVDQDGNEIEVGDPISVDAIKETNGAVYVMNPTTNKYEKKDGWSLDPATGYFVDENKKFVGLHSIQSGNLADCVIRDFIPSDGTTEQIISGLKQSGVATKEYDDAKAANASQEDLDRIAKKLLTQCLAVHGVQPGDKVEVKVTEDDLPKSGPLFSNRNDNDDPNGITAANISISHSWSTGDVEVVPTWTILFGGEIKNTTQNENVDHMITKINDPLDYDPKNLDPKAVGKKLFTGSFNDMYSNMNSVLGNDQRVSNIQLNTSYTSLIEIDTSRDGVSGVDLNDEAMNMMQYQKAYSAACRLMTAIDEAIDRLINNTGLAGR